MKINKKLTIFAMIGLALVANAAQIKVETGDVSLIMDGEPGSALNLLYFGFITCFK